MTHRLALLLALAVVIAPAIARADSVTHVLAELESLETVARQYYGDASWADGLRRYNALGSTDPVAGTVLVVPLPSVHRVVQGDSWESLANRYWDDAALGESLAEWSDPSNAELIQDQEIRIPVLLPHGLRPGESLAALSRRLTGGPDKAESLAALNRIEEPRRLAVGQVVRVPILGMPHVGTPSPEPADPPVPPPPELPIEVPADPVEPASLEPAVSVALELPQELPVIPLEPTSLEPAASAAPEAATLPAATPLAEPPMTQPEELEEAPGFSAELHHAAFSCRSGEFERARELLEALRPVILAEGSVEEQLQLLRQLTEVYAAFDEPERLCTSYRALRALDPSFEWDPDLTSPKIIGLANACGRP